MIITLCGSAKFEHVFHAWNEVLTLSGHTVFGLAVYPSNKKKNKNWYTPQEKELLDKAHLQKIDASDAVMVLNKHAYIGESTMREIEYAKKHKKKLYALESWGKGLGVSYGHEEAYQQSAKKYGALHFKSPIDTFYPFFSDPWSLLPEAGVFRSTLVERLEKADAK